MTITSSSFDEDFFLLVQWKRRARAGKRRGFEERYPLVAIAKKRNALNSRLAEGKPYRWHSGLNLSALYFRDFRT
jgi:hypothetical protein